VIGVNLLSSADADGCDPETLDRCNSLLQDNIHPVWDFIILTASNEEQALSYRKQIEFRLEKGLLSKDIHYAVVPDIEGKRIGSGGATLNVLRYIRDCSIDVDCFSGKHILVINSGGDSMRIPQYSACGKIFAPVARELSEGISATFFDEIIKSVAELPSRLPAGMLILAGDILLVFDPLRIELTGCDAAAMSVSENILKGTNHGVFIPDDEGNVKKFMHKSSIADLREFGAEDNDSNVHLDTGAIWLGENIINDLLKLLLTGSKINNEKYKKFINEKARLSFYADFVYPMARDSCLDRFYLEIPEGGYTDELKNCRTSLWQALHKYSMKLVDMSPAFFIHFGTTAELLKIMTSDIEKYACFGWKSAVNTNIDASGKFSVNSSFVDKNTEIGDGSYIENSLIYNSKVGKNCIISNTTLNLVKIPDNVVIHSLKQNDGDFVVRIYGINDDPKLGFYDGGTFLGIPIRNFLKEHRLKVSDLWDSEPYCLWDAKLFCKSASMSQSLEYALSLCTDSAGSCEIDRRVSLQQSYEKADIDDIIRRANPDE